MNLNSMPGQLLVFAGTESGAKRARTPCGVRCTSDHVSVLSNCSVQLCSVAVAMLTAPESGSVVLAVKAPVLVWRA